MNRWVRGLPVILIGVFAATTMASVTQPATADTGAAASARASAPRTPDASTDDLALTLVGGESITVDPGASRTQSFVVTNRSTDVRLTVRLATVDATIRSNGEVRYSRSASATGPANWLTLSDVVATIEPSGKVTGSFTVAPPANADPGDAIVGLVARVDRAVQAAGNVEVPRNESVSLPVAIKVKGAPTALVSIAEVAAVKDNGREYLEITFQNSGATANEMMGQVSVLGARPHTDAIRTTVAPLARTRERVPFEMPEGVDTARVSVVTQDANGDRASWSGAVGYSSHATATTPTAKRASTCTSAATVSARGATRPWLLPVLVGAAFLAAAMWFGAEMRRTRHRRVALIRAAATARPTTAPPAEQAWPPQLGLLASRLDVLVDAIDRLVVRLGEAQSPPTSQPVPTPAAVPAPTPVPVPTAPAVPPAPMPPSPVRPTAEPPVRRPMSIETGAILFAPAASPDDGEYPYDWPTQEQLDQFETQRDRQAGAS